MTMMQRRGAIAILAGLVLANVAPTLVSAAPARARGGEPQALVDASMRTFNMMMADTEMAWLRANIGRAKAVIIAPSVVRAGFIFGGSGGNAVILARGKGKLTGPAFYRLGTASIGFQAGVSDSQVVTLIMTDTALKSVLDGKFKVGGDASAAAGPVGGGAKADVNADFITFSRARGLFGGLNFEGTVIEPHEDFNTAFNGASAADVLTGKAKANAAAAPLRKAVARYAK